MVEKLAISDVPTLSSIYFATIIALQDDNILVEVASEIELSNWNVIKILWLAYK